MFDAAAPDLRREIVQLRLQAQRKDARIAELETALPKRCWTCDFARSGDVFPWCKLHYCNITPDGFCSKHRPKEVKKPELLHMPRLRPDKLFGRETGRHV